MKKKFIALILSTLFLASCGAKQEAPKKEEPKKMEESKKEEKKSSVGFDGTTAEIDDLKIVITDYKVIKPGEKGNEYGKKPVIAFWYDVTNKTDKEIDANTAWLAVFTAIQDNNSNMVNELQVGMLPDEQFLQSQMAIIKKDGTVKNATAYELSDETTPVTLKAKKGPMGEDIGEKKFELK